MTPRSRLALTWTLLLICLLTSLPLLAANPSETIGEKIRVTATGQAEIEGDRGLARDKALKEAFRSALEQALGVRIMATTVMENLTITKDVVVSQTWGHLLSYDLLKEWESQRTYFVTITAEVSADAKWWAGFESTLDVTRIHLKDLVLRETYEAPGRIQPGALYVEQLLILPIKSDKDKLVAINTDSLRTMWQFTLSGRLTAPLVTNGKWVVAVSDKQIVVLDRQYGWVHWRQTLNESVMQPPVIADEFLYVTTQRGRFLALDLRRGNIQWQYLSQSTFLTAPKVAGEQIYFTDGHGYLHALSLNRKSRTFRHMISNQVKAAPTPTQVLTYLHWSDGSDQVVALNSVDGTTVWTFKGDTAPSTTTTLSPYLIQDKLLTVFVQGAESRLYLLDARSGHLLWSRKLPESVTEISGAGNGLIFLNTWRGVKVLDMNFGNVLWETGGKGLRNQLIIGEDRLFYLYDQSIDIYR